MATIRRPGVWRSLVARSVRVGEVPSSNLGTPIHEGSHWLPSLFSGRPHARPEFRSTLRGRGGAVRFRPGARLDTGQVTDVRGRGVGGPAAIGGGGIGLVVLVIYLLLQAFSGGGGLGGGTLGGQLS